MQFDLLWGDSVKICLTLVRERILGCGVDADKKACLQVWTK
jgi:hypothetical protein